eukprot:TRINITY_DN3565_c0_g1_i10.p2 TRINITY_DN3565_c0_g1~~TRINITY_DN3565_c0_g1_i10.p2  ORF type:complete len:153 (-),score=43.76 TRINITY_DN3565_c0_g1_i10:106-564(-)
MMKLKALAERVQEDNNFLKARNSQLLVEKEDLQKRLGIIHENEFNPDTFEIRNLREALVEAKAKLASAMMRETQLREEKREKDRQIENIVSSRKLMEDNLAAQIQNLRIKVDQYENLLFTREREAKSLAEENKLIREMLKQTERRRIELNEM